MTCISNTCADKSRETICGKRITTEFVYSSIDHAYYNLCADDRLKICVDCCDILVAKFEENR